MHLDLRVAQFRPEHGTHFIEKLRDVRDHGDLCLAVLSKRLSGNDRQLVNLLLGQHYQFSRARFKTGILSEKIKQAAQGMEWVIDFVGNQGHEPTGGSQLFRPLQGKLQFFLHLLALLISQFPLRHVSNHADDEYAFRGGQRAQTNVNWKLSTIFAQSEQFKPSTHGTYSGLGAEIGAMMQMQVSIALREKTLNYAAR